MLEIYPPSPDAIDPRDLDSSEVCLPVQRPPHDKRKHVLLSDAYAELDRIALNKDGFKDQEKHAHLMAAFEDALIYDAVTGGFLSALGFSPCGGVELAGFGTDHARIGPYIADWYQGPHRQGAYVVDAKQFVKFLQDNPLSGGLETIVVHPGAPVAARFFAGEGLRIASAMKPCTQKSLAYALEAAFKKRHPNVALNAKAFAMMAAMFA